MENLLFYRSQDIRWRFENTGEIIVYFNSSQFCLLNETASLIFKHCNGVTISHLCDLFKKGDRESDYKRIYFKIKNFLNKLTKRKIILTRLSEPFFISGRLDGIKRAEFYFKDPSAKILDIGAIDHLNFIRPSVPLRVFLKVSDECNLRCKHCYNRDINTERHMSEEDLFRMKLIVDKLSEAGVFKIILNGGEVFLNPYIFELIDYISLKGIIVRINTNGLILNEYHMEKLKNKKGIILAIGIDGLSPDSHDFIRGNGNFRKTIDILKHLSNTGINIYVNFTLTHRNIFDILRLKRFFRSFNVSRIIVNIFIKTGYGMEYIDILGVRKYEFLFLKLFNIFNTLIDGPMLTMFTYCPAGHIEASVDYHGNFMFCELLDYPLGNIMERDLKDIWCSQELSDLTDTERLEGACRSCIFKKRCRGGCRAEAFSATQNLYASDPYCLKGKLIQMFL